MKKDYKVLAINPGSTSTKIGLFEGEKEIFKTTIQHTKEDLAGFETIVEQRPYRTRLIQDMLTQHGVALRDIDAFAARGGGFGALEGGVYAVNEKMLEKASVTRKGTHPANLACIIATDMAKENGQPCYVVNGPSVDELMDLARLTGLKGVYRRSGIHVLNQKEAGHRYAAKIGKKYEDLNLIIAHIGGGISVTAHRKGRMVDSSNATEGEGPMAPTRTGTVPIVDALRLLEKGVSPADLRAKSTLNGGWIDHVGIDNGLELAEHIKAGDKYAELVYETTIYQIAKWICMMAAPLKGQVDAVILTGGLSNDKHLAGELTDYVKYLGPVEVMAGEFELEGLAAGAQRVLNGEEEAKEYVEADIFAVFEERYGI